MYDHDRVAVDCSGRSSNSFLELDPSRKYRRAESTMFIMARTSNALALRHGEEHGINMYVYTVCNEDLCAQTGTPNWAIAPPTHSHSDTGKSMAMDFLQAEQPLTP